MGLFSHSHWIALFIVLQVVDFWIMTTICCKLNQGIMTNWNYSSGCSLFSKANIYISWRQKAAVGLYLPKQKICGVVCFYLVTPGDSGGQRSLVCCSPWGHRVGHDLATEQQGWGQCIFSVSPGTHRLPVFVPHKSVCRAFDYSCHHLTEDQTVSLHWWDRFLGAESLWSSICFAMNEGIGR